MVAGLALSGLIAALAIIAALVALVWWLARWVRVASAKEPDALRVLRKADARIAGLQRSVQDRDVALDRAQSDTRRATRALTVTERQRDEAVENLVAVGDRDGIAAGIRRDIERLRDFSEPLSELPGTDASAPSADRDGDRDLRRGSADGDAPP